MTAPSGRSVLLTYDGSDNLIQAQQKDQNGTTDATTGFTVSANTYGLVTDKYDANNHHYVYGYDANGDLSDVTTPLGHHTHWAYDAMGGRTARTDAMNRATAYTLDNWERVTAVTYPDSSYNSTYGYDCNSNLTAFSNYTGASTRTYDADDRMTSENEYGHQVLGHTYDAAGKKGLLSATAYPDGDTLAYGYTARNEINSVADAVGSAGFVYNADGGLTSATQPNGSSTLTALDAAGRVSGVTMTVSTGGSWQDTYLYDVDGRKAQEADPTSGSTEAFGYNGLGQMTSDVKTGSNTHANTYSANFADTYTYDGVGNRTYRNSPYGAVTQNYDADDEMTGGSDGYAQYTYDADGEQITSTMGGQATTYGWDFDGDLTSITKGGATISFQYDALGRQVYRIAGGVSTNYIYDGGSVVQEWQSGTRTAVYVWGPGGLIRRNGEYPLSDGRGDVRVAADGGGNPTCFQNADASGLDWGAGGSTGSAYQWGGGSGYRMDGDGPAGGNPYYKVGARYYDPDYQRFLSRDTDLSQSPYAYCGGDPVNNTDPSGHDGQTLGSTSPYSWDYQSGFVADTSANAKSSGGSGGKGGGGGGPATTSVPVDQDTDGNLTTTLTLGIPNNDQGGGTPTSAGLTTTINLGSGFSVTNSNSLSFGTGAITSSSGVSLNFGSLSFGVSKSSSGTMVTGGLKFSF